MGGPENTVPGLYIDNKIGIFSIPDKSNKDCHLAPSIRTEMFDKNENS